MVTVSFPGIGIDNITLNPVAISIGNLEIRWYAIFIMTGIILAGLYCVYRSKQEGISFDDILDMAIFAIPFGIVGARLYYVAMSASHYHSFMDVIAIWNGGIAIYGAIIAGAITIAVVCKVKKIHYGKAFDMLAPGVMIAQAIGRWGNFFNGEAYGAKVPEDSIFYFIRMGLVPNIESSKVMHYFHPTFLYESVWNVVGFIIINLIYKKKKFDGQILLMYISWYGFGRMLIEGLRTDSLYLGEFRISQVVGFVCFVVGTALLIYNLVKARRAELTKNVEYQTAYPKFSHGEATAQRLKDIEERGTGEDSSPEADTENEEEEGE